MWRIVPEFWMQGRALFVAYYVLYGSYCQREYVANTWWGGDSWVSRRCSMQKVIVDLVDK